MTYAATVQDANSSLWLYVLISYVVPIAFIVLGGYFLNRQLRKQMGDDSPSMNFGGGGFGLGGVTKSGAKIVADTDNNVTFRDGAGQDEAKESLAEIVNFLEHPEKYAAIGARCPRGALLVGPPGTGKTLLAKAVAGEAKVPFFQISGSEFVEMFVGRGAARVRDLFKQATEKAPCIVFIDEIDTIGKKRGMSLNSNDEREQTLNQLLTEMDGFDNHKGIVVLGATTSPMSLILPSCVQVVLTAVFLSSYLILRVARQSLSFTQMMCGWSGASISGRLLARRPAHLVLILPI